MFNLSDGSNYNTWTMKGSWTDNFSNFGSVNCVGQAQSSKKKNYLFMESVKLRMKKNLKSGGLLKEILELQNQELVNLFNLLQKVTGMF